MLLDQVWGFPVAEVALSTFPVVFFASAVVEVGFVVEVTGDVDGLKGKDKFQKTGTLVLSTSFCASTVS